MPSRRYALATVGSGLVSALAGCQISDTSSANPDDVTSTTPDSNEHTLNARFEEEEYQLRGIDSPPGLLSLDREQIVALSELDSPVRSVVKTAITDGTYATTDPERALLAGIDEISLVTYRGAYYYVTHTFPTYKLSLDKEVDPANAPDGRTVKFEDDAVQSNETISNIIETVTPLGPSHPGQSYTTTRLPTAFREFLDHYDYLKYETGVGELVLTVVERSPPYTVTATKATDEQLYGEEILELDSFTPKERELIRRTLANQRRTPLYLDDRYHTIFPADIPDGFDRRLERESSYIRVGGTIHGFDARHLHWGDLPLDVTVNVVDDSISANSPSRIELAATNTSSTAVELSMPGIAPFGILWAYGPSGERLLWSPEYDQKNSVQVENGTPVPESEAAVSVQPGETISTTYEFGREYDHLELGTYEVSGFVSAAWPTGTGRRTETLPYTLSLAITS